MVRSAFVAFLLPLLAACASGGGIPAGPVAWPPGRYYLEATITYSGEAGTRRDQHSADLYIEADQSMRLDAHDAVCRDPTPPELQRDAERRQRTFVCGDLTYILRPGSETVIGDLQAIVQEGRTVTECLQRAADGSCQQSFTRVVTSAERKESRLRVTAGS